MKVASDGKVDVVIGNAVNAVTALVNRGVLREPSQAIEPLERAGAVHQAIADRTAPAKTSLSING